MATLHAAAKSIHEVDNFSGVLRGRECFDLLAGGFSFHQLPQRQLIIILESFWRRGRKIVAAKEEEDIYAALGLPFIAPELREGQGENPTGAKRKLPKMVSDKDICGILHAHTELSDGVDTLDAMAEATRNRGYAYFGVSNHSKSAHYAGGLSVEEIAEQHVAIDRLNAGRLGS